MGYWLKLYTDVLDDPKYFRLSEEAKLGMFELMLVAKKVESGEMTGNLPPIDEIAFHTRKTSEHWEKIMPELEAIGFVVIERDIPKVKNYVKRQGAIPSETRVKQYRKKRNDGVMGDVTELKRECNEPVTNRNGDKKREEKNKKQNTEKIREDDIPTPFSKLSNIFLEKTGLPEGIGGMKNYADALREMVDMNVTPEILAEAIDTLNEKEYTIASPRSCVTTCRNIIVDRNKTKKPSNEGLAWLESELAKSEEVTNG